MRSVALTTARSRRRGVRVSAGRRRRLRSTRRGWCISRTAWRARMQVAISGRTRRPIRGRLARSAPAALLDDGTTLSISPRDFSRRPAAAWTETQLAKKRYRRPPQPWQKWTSWTPARNWFNRMRTTVRWTSMCSRGKLAMSRQRCTHLPRISLGPCRGTDHHQGTCRCR